VDRNLARGLDPELHGVPIDGDDHDSDVVPDHDGLVEFSAEYEQDGALRGCV
jgi:hypothetical protein